MNWSGSELVQPREHVGMENVPFHMHISSMLFTNLHSEEKFVPGRPRGRKPTFDWTDERLEELRELRSEGLTNIEIAEEMGCTRHHVERAVRYAGITPPKRVNRSGLTAAQIDEIIARHRRGETQQAIADALGTTRNKVDYQIRKWRDNE